MKRLLSVFAIALTMCLLLTSSQSGETPKLGFSAVVVGVLDTELDGTSSLFYWNGELWSCGDHGKLKLFALDTVSAEVKETLTIPARVNDMEEVTQDEEYLYFGDFGNNSSVQRDDLRILRCRKSELSDGDSCHFDTILFTYPGYQPGPLEGIAETDFDCEAMIAAGDSLYLFTKQWGSFKTDCYALPKTSGSYTAVPHGTLNAEGLVTGACYRPEMRLLVLCGYNSVVQPFVYVLYDFEGTDFFGGQREKLLLTNGMGTQTEGIATLDGEHYYLTNEHFTGLGNRPAQLLSLDLTDCLHDYLHPDTSHVAISATSPRQTLALYPNPTSGVVYISGVEAHASVYDMQGHLVAQSVGKRIDLSAQPKGAYFVSLTDKNGTKMCRTIVKR